MTNPNVCPHCGEGLAVEPLLTNCPECGQSLEDDIPKKDLMGKGVTIKSSNIIGKVRGYDPKSGKWWVIIKDGSQYGKTGWYDEHELDCIQKEDE